MANEGSTYRTTTLVLRSICLTASGIAVIVGLAMVTQRLLATEAFALNPPSETGSLLPATVWPSIVALPLLALGGALVFAMRPRYVGAALLVAAAIDWEVVNLVGPQSGGLTGTGWIVTTLAIGIAVATAVVCMVWEMRRSRPLAPSRGRSGSGAESGLRARARRTRWWR